MANFNASPSLNRHISDIICFSDCKSPKSKERLHQLMSKMGNDFNIYIIEEPVFDSAHGAYLSHNASGHTDIAVPHLPAGTAQAEVPGMMQQLLDGFMSMQGFSEYTFWYASPKAHNYSAHYQPTLTIYDHDCMADMAFQAGRFNKEEMALVEKADIIFTSSQVFYNAGKSKYPNLYFIPAYIETTHFGKARGEAIEADIQVGIPFPRLGYAGDINDHVDLSLIASVADAHPNWQIVLTGKLDGVDASALPKKSNIHYLGEASYEELPAYLTGWNAALLLFTDGAGKSSGASYKAAEYMAAGIPVIATPTQDIKDAFGDTDLVLIASDGQEVADAATAIFLNNRAGMDWLRRTDKFIKTGTWDNIATAMMQQMKDAARHNRYLHQVA